MDWKRLAAEMRTCLNGSKNSAIRLKVEKFGAHPRIQGRVNFKIGTLETHQLGLLSIQCSPANPDMR